MRGRPVSEPASGSPRTRCQSHSLTSTSLEVLACGIGVITIRRQEKTTMILVTGATGNIGSALVRQLRQIGRAHV